MCIMGKCIFILILLNFIKLFWLFNVELKVVGLFMESLSFSQESIYYQYLVHIPHNHAYTNCVYTYYVGNRSYYWRGSCRPQRTQEKSRTLGKSIIPTQLLQFDIHLHYYCILGYITLASIWFKVQALCCVGHKGQSLIYTV